MDDADVLLYYYRAIRDSAIYGWYHSTAIELGGWVKVELSYRFLVSS